MSDLDELMALRPKVSELIHALEQEKRNTVALRQENHALKLANDQLRLSLIALRDEQRRSDRTPAFGTPAVPQTDPDIRRTREHG